MVQFDDRMILTEAFQDAYLRLAAEFGFEGCRGMLTMYFSCAAAVLLSGSGERGTPSVLSNLPGIGFAPLFVVAMHLRFGAPLFLNEESLIAWKETPVDEDHILQCGACGYGQPRKLSACAFCGGHPAAVGEWMKRRAAAARNN